MSTLRGQTGPKTNPNKVQLDFMHHYNSKITQIIYFYNHESYNNEQPMIICFMARTYVLKTCITMVGDDRTLSYRVDSKFRIHGNY